jgi:ABC-type transporter Mla subunit MlaD
MRSNLEVISNSYDSSTSDLISSTGKLSNQINLLSDEIQRLRIAAGAAVGDIGVASNRFEESLLASTTSTQSTAEAFAGAGKVFSSAVDEFSLKLAESMPLAAFKDDLSRVQASLFEFVGSLKSSNERANSLANSLDRLSEVIDISGEGIGSRLSGLSDSIGAQTVGFQNHYVNLKEFAESISRQSAKISEFENRISSLCENLNGLDRNLDQAKGIFSGLSALEVHFSSLNAQFSGLANMNVPLKAVSIELEKVVTQLGGVNTEWSLKASRLFDDAFRSQQEFIENLKTSQDALNETHMALIDSIKSIKSQFQ